MSTFRRVHASNIRVTPGETEHEGPLAVSVNVTVPLLSARTWSGEAYGGAA